MPRNHLTPEQIKKLLITSRRTSRNRMRELQIKRDFERLLASPISDSQLRAVMRSMVANDLLDDLEPLRPEPELGATHVVAQRLFYVHPRMHLLESYTKAVTWYPGEIKEAVCRPFHAFVDKHPNEPSPVYDCSCGIWVCNSRAALKKSFPRVRQSKYQPRIIVSAQVEVWGKCIEHEWGWRAQYARVIGETIQIYPRVSGRRVTRERFIGHLRRKYGECTT